MKNCEISIIFAYGMATYCLACVLYIILTRCMHTPFMASLSLEQKQILDKSRRQRRNIFVAGCVLSLCLLGYVKPFVHCCTAE